MIFSMKFLMKFKKVPVDRTVREVLTEDGNDNDTADGISIELYELIKNRLAPSLCISYSTKSDIHGIIMNPS